MLGPQKGRNSSDGQDVVSGSHWPNPDHEVRVFHLSLAFRGFLGFLAFLSFLAYFGSLAFFGFLAFLKPLLAAAALEIH